MMKNKFLQIFSAFALVAMVSCSDDSNQTFDNANGDTAVKLVKNVSVVSAQNPQDSRSFTVNYDANGRVTSASDGTETSFLAYQDGDLSTVSGTSGVFNVSQLYMSPFNAYEVGQVTEYDANGNPVKLRLFERDEDGTILEERVGEISYDPNPNPFFHTLDAAGIIDVLDQVQLNFSLTPQAPQLVMAKLLLPVNNPKKFVVKQVNGQVEGQVTGDYVYDAQGYPSSATFTSVESGGVKVFAATYTYMP